MTKRSSFDRARQLIAGEICLALLLVLLFARWLPHNSLSVTQMDSGIFLYIGQQINRGATPYVDVWDNKPPLIFYIDALGLRLTRGSPLGVVLLAYLSVLAYLVVLYRLSTREFGLRSGALASLISINLLPVLMLNPNSTELFSLPLQALGFTILTLEFEERGRFLYPLLQGSIAAMLFQLRPNNAAVSVLYVLVGCFGCLFRKELTRFASRLSLFCAGGAATTFLVLWPFVSRHCLREYFECAIVYNSRYSATSLFRHVYAVGAGLLNVSRFGAPLAAACGVALLLAERGHRKSPGARRAVCAALLMFLEICFAAVSGRAFEHYYLMWVLPLAILSAFFFRQMELGLDELALKWQGGVSLTRAAFQGAAALLLVSSLFESAQAIGYAKVRFEDKRAGVVEFIRQRTSRDEKVFVWGGPARRPLVPNRAETN